MFEAHAYLARGSSRDVPSVLALLEEGGIETKNNPDLYVRTYGSVSIDDARQLIERAALRPVGARRVFLISADAIHAEAQNALLKTLEEPAGRALFIILHRAPDTLFPTLRSRAQTMEIRGGQPQESPLDVDAFLRSSARARLEMLKTVLEKGETESRDLGATLAFLSALEERVGSKNPHALAAVYRAKKYAGDRGALIKPLLEQVALLA